MLTKKRLEKAGVNSLDKVLLEFTQLYLGREASDVVQCLCCFPAMCFVGQLFHIDRFLSSFIWKLYGTSVGRINEL